jgi:hypothetical protein
LTSRRKVWTGSAFTGVAAIIAAWIAFGLSGTPNTGSGCPLPAYPDTSCTGIPAGTTLTPVDSGPDLDYVVSTTNAVLDAVNVNGCVDVRASGVVIKNSRIRCARTDQSGVAQDPANAPLTVQDSEIDCQDNGALGAPINTGMVGSNYVVKRTDIHGCENGLDMQSDDILQDSYIHDLTQCDVDGCPEPSPHTDGIQSGGGSNLAIVHNRIYGFSTGCVYPNNGTCNGTSAVNLGGNASFESETVNTLVKDNLLAGGAFTLYCTNTPIAPINFQILRNHFSRIYSPHVGEFGPTENCTRQTFTDNVYDDTGLPVPAF